VLAAEHFDAAPTVLILTTSLNSCGCLYGRVCMLPSHDPLPFIRLFVSQNQAVWARTSGTDWVKLAVHVSSSALYRLFGFVPMTLFVQIWIHYSDHYSAPKRIFGTFLLLILIHKHRIP